MIISNFQEFYNLIKTDAIPVKNQLENCINTLARICNCKREVKASKNTECNNIYINFIKSNGQSLKDFLKSKTKDKEVVFNHDAHYHIVTVNLTD